MPHSAASDASREDRPMSASTFGSHDLGTNDRAGRRLYFPIVGIILLGFVAVGRTDAQILPPDAAPEPGAVRAAADTPFSDAVVAPPIQAASNAPGNVTTYHYDTRRTGWNPNETTLKPGPSGNVNPGSFGVLQTVELGDSVNDYVDAQPLVVEALTINGPTPD